MLEQILPTIDVTDAGSGDEALAALREVRFDVVLSGHASGEIDGISLLERARRDHPGSCRILFTRSTDVDVASDAIERAGVHGFLRMPLQQDILEKVLRSGIVRVREEILLG
jgi:DNA-binding NtrC family response regulator